MKLITLIILLFSFTLVSCSGSKKAKDAVDDAGGAASDVEEFTEEEFNDDIEAEDGEEVAEADGSEPVIDSAAGGLMTYTVQKNETLMLVAFKLYGDYSQWRKIAELNADQLNGSNQIKEGMTLNYNAAEQEFVWNPEGNPWLIKNGDTLGTISNDVYDTTKHWKAIWKNNEPLIKDPNKIFVGFTIYTPELDEGREVAQVVE